MVSGEATDGLFHILGCADGTRNRTGAYTPIRGDTDHCPDQTTNERCLIPVHIHADSHVDHLHGISKAVVDYVLEQLADEQGGTVVVHTIYPLLPELGRVPCGLYGPTMGDPPITDDQVTMQARGKRQYQSRLVDQPVRMVDKVTVITGPHDGHPCVLYTMFGGPSVQREPGELEMSPRVTPEELEVSRQFWSQHALVMDESRTT